VAIFLQNVFDFFLNVSILRNMKNIVTDTSILLEPIPAISELLSTLAHRVQKINQAVVLVTAYIPDSLAMKLALVNESFLVLDDIHHIEIAPEYATVRDITNLSISLRHILDLFEIAYRGTYVSEMNFSILQAELSATLQFIDQNIMMYCVGSVTFPFRIPTTPTALETEINLGTIFTDNQITDKKYSLPEIKKNNPNEIFDKTVQVGIQPISRPIIQSEHQPSEVKDKEKIVTPSVLGLHLPTVKPVLGEDKKERRDAIMRTIRSKGQVTIKDISENISGCSEKTIQRDLQELIQHGVLKRM
jgi:hypothetical protein